jgi:phosphatidylethanolamine/phosphatidyl-N-methylethanolamine N-methyltransferase
MPLHPTSQIRTSQARAARGLFARTMADLDEKAVRVAYRRWAPIYDETFGRVAAQGRRQVVAHVNKRQGRVLEVGVGTGLSLPDYGRHLDVVGIDLSPDMLERARERVKAEGLGHVSGLHVMDAAATQFADASFDTVVAMYVMTVVPDAARVMRELSRLAKPGGEVVLINHFSRDGGVRGYVEKQLAPFGDTLGWRPVFPLERVLVCDDLTLIERRDLTPFGLFTMLRFGKAQARAAA